MVEGESEDRENRCKERMKGGEEEERERRLGRVDKLHTGICHCVVLVYTLVQWVSGGL